MFAGGVGCGKTVIAHECTAHNISVHKEPCFVIPLKKTILKLVGILLVR